MTAIPDETLPWGRAFGIDPTRPERYSLRQSRYEALAADISAWAGEAAHRGDTLSLLDIGCGWGPLLRYLDTKPPFDRSPVSPADWPPAPRFRKAPSRESFTA